MDHDRDSKVREPKYPPESVMDMFYQQRLDQLTGRELRERAVWGEGRYGAKLTGELEAARYSISNRLIAERDLAMIDAINKRLGRDDWTARETHSQVSFHRSESGTTEVRFCGEPLLRVYPPEIQVQEEGPSTYLTAKQKIWRAK